MEWTLTAPIISHEKNYRFAPLTNRHHEVIIKYCTGKDDAGLVMFMQDMLQELSLDKSVKYDEIPAIDQLFLLLRLRSICIGTRIDILVDGKNEEGETVPVKHRVSLIDIQKSINKEYIQPIELIDDTNSIKTVLHYPTTWQPQDETDWIRSVTIDDTHVDFDTLEKDNKHKLLENMYRDYRNTIDKNIHKLEQSIDKMIFVRIPSENPGENDPNITISHDQFYHIIRVLYSDTLNNFAELMYVFVKVMNFSLSDAMKLTPSDTQLYYQMFVKEQNEKEKAARAAQQAAKSNSRTVGSR
jgi:hypothetical protein